MTFPMTQRIRSVWRQPLPIPPPFPPFTVGNPTFIVSTQYMFYDAENKIYTAFLSMDTNQLYTVNWGDGHSDTSSGEIYHNYYYRGFYIVEISPANDWNTCTILKIKNIDGILGAVWIVSLPQLPLLDYLDISNNYISGSLPSFSVSTLLQSFNCSDNQINGTLLSFANCTIMSAFYGTNNQFADYEVGGFVTQYKLGQIHLENNLLSQTAVDNILADCVVSLSLGLRTGCVVDLSGTGNAVPSTTTNKNILNGTPNWTVTTN